MWRAGAVVAGLIAAWQAPAHAAITCEAAPPPRITVEAVPPTPTIDGSLDLATLKQRSAGNILHGELGQPLGVTVTQLVGDIEEMLDFDPRAPAPTVCGAAREVRVRVGFEPTVIYIAREVARDRCLYDQVLQHENRHILVDREVLALFAPRIEANMRALTARTGVVRGASRDAVWASIHERLRAQLDADLRALMLEMRKRQQIVDRPEEYRRLSASCGGVVRRLLAD